MYGLLRRLETIQRDCLDGANLKAADPADQGLDEFTRLKKKIATDIRQIRVLIKDRDEMEKDAPGTVATVELSHNIRAKLKDLRADATALDKLQKDEVTGHKKKNKEDPQHEELMTKREEVVGLVFQHLEEVNQLDKRRGSGSAFAATTSSQSATVTELPDVDDPQFQVLIRNDKIIDGQLDEISTHVTDLKAVALTMGDVATSHGRMLESLEVKVDKANDELDNINTRLRKTLEQVRKGDRFIIDLILLIILLGLGGFIYSLAK